MTTELTNEEKLTIVNQHIRSLNFSKYNIETSIARESAVEPSDAQTLADLSEQLTMVETQISVLQARASALQ